jgi:hypothetical protein
VLRVAFILLLGFITIAAPAAPRRRAVAVPAIPSAPHKVFTFDFASGRALGWQAGYSDYTIATADLRVVNELRLLPPEVGGRPAWYLSGWNYSDDLFLFLTRRLTPADGIVANQNYIVTTTVTFATNAGPGCVGIGGAPGESVFLKIGAAPVEPAPRLIDDHYIGNTADKGNQAQSGVHASMAGTLTAEVELPCGMNAPFTTVVRQHSHNYAIASSAEGDLWLLFGIDSGFEGFNQIYVQHIEVALAPVAPSDPRARWQTTYAELESILTDLRAAGLTLRGDVTGGIHDPLLGGRWIPYAIGEAGSGESIRFYLFDTAEATASARSLISPDGEWIAGEKMDWHSPSHFFLADQMIIHYVGTSPAMLSLLTDRFGSQFAGSK